MNKVSVGTIARTAALAVTLINTVLSAAGKNPLPYSDTDIFNAVSTVATIAAALAAWWKNNSFTSEAIRADRYMHELKDGGESDF